MSDNDRRYVWQVVLPQTLMGLAVTGLFYGWGALAIPIDNEVTEK